MAGGWGKLLDATVPPATLLEAQKYVRHRLENKWLPLFLATSRFAERQRPETGLDNITEDLLIQKRKKSQALYKVDVFGCLNLTYCWPKLLFFTFSCNSILFCSLVNVPCIMH